VHFLSNFLEMLSTIILQDVSGFILKEVTMKFKILSLLAIVTLISACGGGGAGSTGGTSSDNSSELKTFFPLYSGFKSTYTDGEATLDANSGPWQRSNVSLEVLEGNKLHITSVLDYGAFTDYHADCDETHEFVIEGNSIKLVKTTVVLNWAGDPPETWTQVWEYNPPVTLIQDRTAITAGTVTTPSVSITHSGEIMAYVDPSGERRREFPPPTEPTSFEVMVSGPETIQVAGVDVETYKFIIKWIYGAEMAPSSDVPEYTTFEGFSLLAPSFHLAKGEGIVAFGTGVIKK
jgi:hypothetical protein